ncbi:MauE/DoxX family redox-associated membrane protein [Chryseolinea lacunae]|uniref:DoxX family membrane protein n=1 Tax=Chryseolinea lacunae TaxID=2801331 RepID=A0ABS1KZF9_9BACT|nr:MauE/DoxX family redox-associated membrane protein [Chryseolinea lacunae]MBL0744851.1 DoxX family membrane protein [Chryseolinea lacunae]
MHRTISTGALAAILVILFAYTAFSKLLDVETFSDQMRNQPLPSSVTAALVWIVPTAELVAVVLLIVERLRRFGFLLSFLILLTFSVYTGLVLARRFAFIPCSCGGIFRTLSWEAHLIVNVISMLIAFTGWLILRSTPKHH